MMLRSGAPANIVRAVRVRRPQDVVLGLDRARHAVVVVLARALVPRVDTAIALVHLDVARVLGRRGVTHRRHATAIAHRRLAAITTADSSLHLHHSLTNLFLSHLQSIKLFVFI